MNIITRPRDATSAAPRRARRAKATAKAAASIVAVNG